MKQLFFLATAQLACMPANSNIYSTPELRRDICHACTLPNVMSLGFAYDHVSTMLFGLHSIPAMYD